LAAINAIEKMAIVDEESRADSPLCTQVHEHDVKTEYLHVLDALAT